MEGQRFDGILSIVSRPKWMSAWLLLVMVNVPLPPAWIVIGFGENDVRAPGLPHAVRNQQTIMANSRPHNPLTAGRKRGVAESTLREKSGFPVRVDLMVFSFLKLERWE
jgi:hypothetical protein